MMFLPRPTLRPAFFSVGLCLGFCAQAAAQLLAGSGASLRPDKFEAMDAAINRAIADKQIPGGVLWLEHRGQSYHKAYGHRALMPQTEPMTEDTIFDFASLTKVAAGAPAVMLLV